MKDGLRLGQFLAERKNEETIPELLKRYENEMLVRGSEGVMKSREAAEDHVEETNQSTEGEQCGKDWLTSRISKQAGDQGFKRVPRD